MGAVGGMLGLGGGAGGSGFSTQAGTDKGQLDAAYAGNQAAMAQQNNLLSALQGQHGLQNQSNVYNQLQGVVSGQGPNPAQAMLNQATGANVANQAALMGGQRGASQNAGLLARQAAQTGAGLQQQAAGQGASMQAQQSLGALGQAGSMADLMAQNQIGQTNQNVTSQQNEQNILQGANTANNTNQAALAGERMKTQSGALGQVFNAASAGAGMLFGGKKAYGGEIGYADGGPIGPQSRFGRSLMGAPQMAEGGKVPSMVSPGEKFLQPQEATAVASGQVSPRKVGEMIPGQAKVKGDSYKNDVVRKDLDEGGVVIPRSVMQSKNPEQGAAKFVRDVLAKKRVKK